MSLATALAMLASCTLGGHPEDSGNQSTPGPAPTAAVVGTSFAHVFIIVMENEEASAVYNTADAPYINGLGGRYAEVMRYYAVTHPSLPNYLALTAGTPNPLDGTDCPVSATCHVAGAPSNVADEIEASGRTWAAYMEDMPSPCALHDAGAYAVRHNPFVYFDDIRAGANRRCASHDLPYDAGTFATQLQSGQVPDFVWISPNLCHDGHDPCGGNPIRHADAWLAHTVPPILASSAFRQGGVLFVVWDEGSSSAACCGLGEGGGQVALFVISPIAKSSYRAPGTYDHYSLLRTIEDNWRLGELANTNPGIFPGTNSLADLFTQP
jgi:hypothetical protein